jgi:hypothetical protein
MAENGFIRNERNEVVYYTIPLFENTKLTRHGFFHPDRRDEPGRMRRHEFQLFEKG